VRRLIYLGLLIILGFGLRVHLLGNQELRGDEGFTWNYIQKSPPEIVATIVREGDPQPPLHYWLQWGWLQLTGDSEFAMRAWSACLSLLLIPLIYQVGRKLWRTEIGLIAAALTSIHPQQIWLAQDVRNMYQLAIIFLLIATYALLQTPTKRQWWLYVISGALAMYSHYYSLFLLIAHGALLATSRPFNLKRLGTWVLTGLIIAALIAPWAFIILPVYLGGQLADPGSLSFTHYTLLSLGDLIAGPAQTDPIKLAYVSAFAILATLSLFSHPNLPSLRPFVLASLLIPFFGIYIVTATRSTFNTFYLTFAFPAVSWLIASATFFFYQKFKPLGWTIVTLGLIGYSLGLYNHYYNPDYSKTRGFREIVAYLHKQAQPNDIYLANAPDPAQVYYLRNLAVNYRMQPGQIGLPAEQINLELSELTSRRLWFVPANSALDPNQYVAQRLSQIAILDQDLNFQHTNLKLFLPLNSAQPLNAQFSDGIRLIGYHYTANRLTLVWTTTRPPTHNYTVFVHALAADTFNLNGHDAPPYTPTSYWQPDQLVVDVHPFEIPTDQPVTLVAGLYDPQTGDRLPLQTDSWGEPDSAKVITLSP